MSEAAGDGLATGSLPELAESLPAAMHAPALAPGSTVGLAGDEYRIETLLRDEPPLRQYEAVDAEERNIWLREACGSAAAAWLRREAEALESLKCPMFLSFPHYFEVGESAFLAVPRPEGQPLSAWLAQGPLRPLQVLSTLAQIAYALSQLHAHGWVHLGVRPTAILLGKPVRFTDLAGCTRRGETPEVPCFHAGYSAPEIASGVPADPRADVYSVGALLYQAVSGAPVPESGADLGLWSPPQPLAGLPQILHRCLGPVETRYARMEELHRDLLRLASRLRPQDQVLLGAESSIGLEPGRTTNQDAFGMLTGRYQAERESAGWVVACVADGMGGMAAGEVASEIAVKTVLAEAAGVLSRSGLPTAAEQAAAVKKWAQAANTRVCDELERQRARGGCTLVAACLIGRRLAVAHVGDCRLYRVHGEGIELLTRDHSLAMALVVQGDLTEDEVRTHPDRNRVTRSLGERAPLPDYFIDSLEQRTESITLELQSGDLLLLCSDGLWEPVLENEMLEICREWGADPQCAARELVRLSLERGAPDNSTALVLRLEDSPTAGS